MGDAAPDLTNLPRFLKHLGAYSRDPLAAAFARTLLDAGWEVETFWGPQQMDVWLLRLARGSLRVTFGVERGYPDRIIVFESGGPARHWGPLDLVVQEWAQAHGVELEADRPARRWTTEQGLATLDWLEGRRDFPM